jgi:Rrf2 family iron-sulfur cluster assembly transcriptional regulator
MRLSTKGRYAVMAMADLAGNATEAQMPGESRPVALADIAARQDISLPIWNSFSPNCGAAGW